MFMLKGRKNELGRESNSVNIGKPQSIWSRGVIVGGIAVTSFWVYFISMI